MAAIGTDITKQNNSNIAVKLPPTGFVKKPFCQNSFPVNLITIFCIILIEKGKVMALIMHPMNA